MNRHFEFTGRTFGLGGGGFEDGKREVEWGILLYLVEWIGENIIMGFIEEEFIQPTVSKFLNLTQYKKDLILINHNSKIIMLQIDELKKLIIEIGDLKLKNDLSNSFVKDILTTTITNLIQVLTDKIDGDNLEYIYLKGYDELEEFGWDIEDTDTVLGYWIRLGNILKIDNPEIKLNYIDQSIPIDLKIENLIKLKSNKKINFEILSAPIFYNEMRRLMDESIDNVIRQLKINNKIDEMLKVFDNDVNKFINLKTDDFSFGDTEDRETIGEFYMEIMKILGMKYSRGLLRSKLE